MSKPVPALIAAFDRIDEFRAIHEPGVSREAVECLQEAVGIDEATRVLIRERFDDLGSRDRGATLLGLIIGLLAAQFEGERADPA